jgi:hypothetical protein
MPHITIHFLTQAEDFEDAISRTEEYLESESDFYESYEVLRKESGWLPDLMDKVNRLLDRPDSITRAETYLAEAEVKKRIGDFGSAGYCYRRAGLLYEGALTQDMPVYNIDSFDYAIPFETRGWFAIAVYFEL